MAFTASAVCAPRSFWKTTPRELTRNVMMPLRPYSAGHAMSAYPPVSAAAASPADRKRPSDTTATALGMRSSITPRDGRRERRRRGLFDRRPARLVPSPSRVRPPPSLPRIPPLLDRVADREPGTLDSDDRARLARLCAHAQGV